MKKKFTTRSLIGGLGFAAAAIGLWACASAPVEPVSAHFELRGALDLSYADPRQARTPRTTNEAEDIPGFIDPIQTGAISQGAFGSVAIPMRNFPVMGRWSPVFRGVKDCAAGGACLKANRNLAKLFDEARKLPFREKLAKINVGVNRHIAYRNDRSTYGRMDYWAKPAEIMKRGVGDCEDFAILKMAGLIRAGVPANSLSIVILQDTSKRVFHAVLTVSTGSGMFVLDNTRNYVAMDTDLPSYMPLYSFSTDRAWIHGSRTGGTQVASISAELSDIAPGEGPGNLELPAPEQIVAFARMLAAPFAPLLGYYATAAIVR